MGFSSSNVGYGYGRESRGGFAFLCLGGQGRCGVEGSVMFRMLALGVKSGCQGTPKGSHHLAICPVNLVILLIQRLVRRTMSIDVMCVLIHS